MYLFSEKSMRKEVPSLARRFSKANNKYVQSYDSNKKSKYILYLDWNNLYNWPMSWYISYNGFKCLNKKEIDKFDLNSFSENSSMRYISGWITYITTGHLLPPEKLGIIYNISSNYWSNIANK